MSEPRLLRFAVGAFDSWEELDQALQALRVGGMALDSFNCLALERVLAGHTIIGLSQEVSSNQLLAFPENRESIACTAGPLADCLSQRFQLGAISLKDALGRWLIPRHAAQFQGAVESGSVLLWVRLADADEERRAYLCLLAHSSSSVGVHDLAPPPASSSDIPV